MSVKMKTDADFADSLEYHKEVAENYREAYAALKAKADRLAEALEKIKPVQYGPSMSTTDEQDTVHWMKWALRYRDIARAALADYRKGE